MDSHNFRGYFILAGFLVVFFVILILIPGNKPTPTKTGPTVFPSPTSYELSPNDMGTNKITPTLIPAIGFTGAKDEPLPKTESDLVNQKNSLINKTPLQGNYFTITFSYKTDKFSVQLKDPKADSQQKFEQWLKTNYPAVPIDRFIIN